MFLEGFLQEGSCPSRSRCLSRCSWTPIDCLNMLSWVWLVLAFLIVLSWREAKDLISEQQRGKKVFWSEFNIFESPIMFCSRTDVKRKSNVEVLLHPGRRSQKEKLISSKPKKPWSCDPRLSPQFSRNRGWQLGLQSLPKLVNFSLQGRASSRAGSWPEHR